jgi:hypothetical protein
MATLYWVASLSSLDKGKNQLNCPNSNKKMGKIKGAGSIQLFNGEQVLGRSQ